MQTAPHGLLSNWTSAHQALQIGGKKKYHVGFIKNDADAQRAEQNL